MLFMLRKKPIKTSKPAPATESAKPELSSPSPGDKVFFTVKAGQTVPAVVVEVRSATLVDLRYFADGRALTKKNEPDANQWRGNVPYSATNDAGTWK